MSEPVLRLLTRVAYSLVALAFASAYVENIRIMKTKIGRNALLAWRLEVKVSRGSLPASIALLLLMTVLGAPTLMAQENQEKQEIEAFNRRFTAAHLKMDNATVISMWAEDGVSLLPGMDPLSGKGNIAKWLEDITARMPGYHVIKQQNDFHDILISGDWASEWATTIQITQPPEGKAPIEVHGKILLVLHKEADGKWKIKQEMWNAGPLSTKAEAESTR